MVLQFAPVSSDGCELCELPLSSHGLPASYVPCLSMVRDLFRVPVPPLLSPLLEPPPRPSFFVHCCELLVHCRKLLAGKALNDSASSDTQSPSIIQIIPILPGTVTMKPAFFLQFYDPPDRDRLFESCAISPDALGAGEAEATSDRVSCDKSGEYEAGFAPDSEGARMC